MAHSPALGGQGHPLVVALNCLDDPSLEQELLEGVAAVEHVPLSALATGRVESAAAVLLPSLAYLPRAAQRRLRPWQLLLCLGSSDRAADAAAAADLGLRLVHVDANRAEEVADTVMALFLGLLRRTHLLSRHVSSAPAAVAAGCLGSVQPLCRGMRRCRGLVLGIIGRSASARCLATRSLAFRMSVLYFDPRYLVPDLQPPTLLYNLLLILGSSTIYLASQVRNVCQTRNVLTHLGIQNSVIFRPWSYSSVLKEVATV
jgi:phosphoglycerate dehydrogenase-like enzyme